jgi:hypothetical protein
MGWLIGGFESRQELGIFLFTTASRPALGTRGSFSGGKVTGAGLRSPSTPSGRGAQLNKAQEQLHILHLLQWSLQREGVKFELDSSDSRLCTVAGFCEQDKEPSGAI